jgi:hypothetical protein
MQIAKEYNRMSIAAKMKRVGEELSLAARALWIGYSANVTHEQVSKIEKALIDLEALLNATVDINKVTDWSRVES